MNKPVIISALLALLVSGCTSPYSSKFSCPKKGGFGTCSSISENYKTIYEPKESKSVVIDKLDKKQESVAEEEMIRAIWIRQRTLEQKMGE